MCAEKMDFQKKNIYVRIIFSERLFKKAWNSFEPIRWICNFSSNDTFVNNWLNDFTVNIKLSNKVDDKCLFDMRVNYSLSRYSGMFKLTSYVIIIQSLEHLHLDLNNNNFDTDGT